MANAPRISWLFAIPIVAGLVWLTAGASASFAGFIFGALPGALLVAGGVSQVWLPRDGRTLQMSALGGGLGLVLALPMVFVVGFLDAIWLFALATASFVAAGWASQVRQIGVEGVPEPELDLRLAAKVALDEAILATVPLARRGFGSLDTGRVVEEVRAAHELFQDRGWIEKPGSFYEEPPKLESPRIRWKETRKLRYEHLSFDSGYEPADGLPGRERWLGYAANRTAHAWVVRDGEEPRPWVVCIHGLGMGIPLLDFAAFEAERLHRELGHNLVFPVLPLHGPRKIGLRSGDGFVGGELIDTINAEAQAIWDIRRLLGWVRAAGAESVGVHGLSLGGYSAALLAGLDDDLACVIVGVPAVDFLRGESRLSVPDVRRALERHGLEWSEVDEVMRVISPLAIEPLVPPERCFIYAGTVDRLVTADQPRDLWKHWGEPQIAWYHGSHLSFRREPGVRKLVDRALREWRLGPMC
ncbi:MAG: alpha/beta hydrolase [Myxococcota bacterium]